jgi:hypothetical protein
MITSLRNAGLARGKRAFTHPNYRAFPGCSLSSEICPFHAKNAPKKKPAPEKQGGLEKF